MRIPKRPSTNPLRKPRVLVVVAAGLILVQALAAEDWPHWRGPHRNGHSAELSGWGKGGWPVAKPAWAARVGAGGTGPVVARGRQYTMGWAGAKDHVYCLDAATGKEIWKTSYACPAYGRHHLGDESAYSGPAATPEFDGDTSYLYTLSIDGHLHCWDTRNQGRKVWGLNLYDKFGVGRRPEVGRKGTHRDYGYITAPLVHGDWLLVEVGAKQGNLMAFARRTGRLLWTSDCKEPAGHCGGLAPMTVAGVPCVAVLTLRKLIVIRLDPDHAGQTVAEYPWVTDFGNNIASPAVASPFVLITSAYNHSAICKLKITLRGATKVWQKAFASKVCTPVIHGRNVYWAWNRLRCLDLETGRQKWEGGNFGDAASCIVTADHKLIAWGGQGQLVLVEAAETAPDRYKVLARSVRLAATVVWPHVALAGGRLYCKDRDGNLKCFTVTGSRR